MEKSKFWNANSVTSINSIGGGSKGSSSGKNGNKTLLKGLGLTGIVTLIVLGIFGILLYIYILTPAYTVMSAFNTLKADMNDATVSLTNRDLVLLAEDLNSVEKDLNNLRSERDKQFGWAKDVKTLDISEFYSDSDRFINAGLLGVEAVREVSVIVTPFADAAGLKVLPEQEVAPQAGLMEAFQMWVSLMPEVAGKMDGVIEKVSKIGNELKPINVEKYPVELRGVAVRENIRFIKDTLSGADQYAPDIKLALTLFPRVLGIDTPLKRYMILMQNDKEIRPTGGFMTNYATFKIDNGLLQSDFTSKDMYSIDNTLDIVDATYDFPDAPAPYMKYLKVERWYARDMNYSPDFVDSMNQLLKFYNMAGTIAPYDIKPVDGIVAIDTEVIRELLEVTGPVTVNGITYTPDNVVLELEKIASLQLQEQANRKRVLGDLMEAMLVNVFESDHNLWTKLIDKAVDLSVRKHVQVYLFDAEAQALVEKYGLAGRIKEPVTGDYSMVVSTNLGGDKTNWFVGKEVNHTLTKEGNRWLRKVNIKYTYIEPTGDYTLFSKRFRDWVRVYAPAGSTFINVEGSEDGTMTDQERGKVWYSGYVEMSPGESKEMTFSYYLPDNMDFKDAYELTLQKQGGVKTEIHNVSINGKKEKVELKTDRNIRITL
jgi:hypothetical protein